MPRTKSHKQIKIKHTNNSSESEEEDLKMTFSSSGEKRKPSREDEVYVSSKRRKEEIIEIKTSGRKSDKPSGDDTEWPIQDELRNPDLEKELEKRIRRRGDGFSDKDKYQDDARERDDKRLSSRGDRAKYKDDDRHKGGSNVDKYRENDDKDNRHREDKYREEGKRENIHRDVKYREDAERRKDDKYREDNDRGRHRDEKKYHEDGERGNRHKVDKHREDGDKENKRRDDKYREDGDRENKCRDDKYREDGDRENKRRDDKYREDRGGDSRHKDEKHWEDADRENRHRDGKQRDDFEREKRVRDVKYRDEHTSRDRTSELDTKRLKEESNAADLYYRKPSTRDGSPVYDDRSTRYKDDKGRKRSNDKEDHGDIRSRSSKEQRSDVEKKRYLNSAKADLVTDRGRSISRNADVENNLKPSHWRSSPNSSSHAARDHHRFSKQDVSKYRDYGYEERLLPLAASNREFSGAGLTEKLSSSRIEKSIQKDDNHLGESSAERGPRSDAARGSPLQILDKSPSATSNDRRHSNRSDVKRSLDVEESGQRNSGLKDELSQAEVDNSVSSPFTRTGHFSGNSRSFLPPPPPPFRTGVDSPLVFGSSEEDSRGSKSNNRHRRLGDPNMGRGQGNNWKGVQTWPLPVGNGFMPFQHGPPPVGFHPVMQQFPGPPVFNVRPSMEMNHAIPYHGRPLLRGWDSSNTVFGDESHIYGRLDWDHNRTQMSSRGKETSGDIWKGQNNRVSADVSSVLQMNDNSAHVPADEVWIHHSDQQALNKQIQPELQAESGEKKHSDALEKITPEIRKTTREESLKMSKKDDNRLCRYYLSKLDISADLTQPELYDQCVRLMDMDQNMLPDEDNYKILYVAQEVLEAKTKVPDKTYSTILFPSIIDSLFQKAMSLYEKQREEMGAISRDKVLFPNVESVEFVPTSETEKDAEPGEHKKEAEGGVSNNNNQEKAEPLVSAYKKLDEPLGTTHLSLEKSEEEPISALNDARMEVDLISNEQAVDISVDENEDANGDYSFPTNNEEQKLVVDTKLLFSDVSCEAIVMPVSIESESVNLSRIHQSPPQSTH